MVSQIFVVKMTPFAQVATSLGNMFPGFKSCACKKSEISKVLNCSNCKRKSFDNYLRLGSSHTILGQCSLTIMAVLRLSSVLFQSLKMILCLLWKTRNESKMFALYFVFYLVLVVFFFFLFFWFVCLFVCVFNLPPDNVLQSIDDFYWNFVFQSRLA